METIIVALITGVVGVVSGHFSAKAQRHAAVEETHRSEMDRLIAPYESLANRAAQLETEARRLNHQVRYLIQRDIAWQTAWDKCASNWGVVRESPAAPPCPVPPLSLPDKETDQL